MEVRFARLLGLVERLRAQERHDENKLYTPSRAKSAALRRPIVLPAARMPLMWTVLDKAGTSNQRERRI